MSFDYDEVKDKDEQGSLWASYADLFTMLSMVFLLLYVISSLRSGTESIKSTLEFQKLQAQNEDLQNQIKVYNTLKDNYLSTGASQDEQKLYEELMDKLVLLKEEAKQEKNDLRKAALENEQKEQALNKYQQMIRNIINNNLISSARIKRRDIIISEQDSDIQDLSETVKEKEQTLKKTKSEMNQVSRELDQKIKQLKSAYQSQKITKKKMEQKIAELRDESKKQIQVLSNEQKRVQQELMVANQSLEKANQDLSVAQSELTGKEKKLQKLLAEKSKYNEQIDQLQTEFEQRQAKEKQKFDQMLAQEKLTAAARAKKIREFQQEAERKAANLAGKVSELSQKIESSEGQLKQVLQEKERAMASVEGLKKEKQTLSKDLKQAKSVIEARQKLIEKIRKNLAKAGVQATVDPKTGEVLLTFGDEYFDTGKATLKTGMIEILEKFIPIYAQSLFEDPVTAKKVSSVEIVGFASPTYKGKYVDPVSLKARDREAANYNLDLSYYRARSIFDHIFDTTKMTYMHQQTMLPKVKVTGRSFFSGEVDPEEQAKKQKMSMKDYCKKFDCKKQQRVVIRFDMDK